MELFDSTLTGFNDWYYEMVAMIIQCLLAVEYVPPCTVGAQLVDRTPPYGNVCVLAMTTLSIVRGRMSNQLFTEL